MATPTFTNNTAMFDPRQFPGLFIWNDASDLTGTNGLALTSNVWINKALDTTYASSCSTTARLSTNTLKGFPVMDFLTTQFYRFNNTVVTQTDMTMLFVTRNIGTAAASRRIFQSSNRNILYGYWQGLKNVLYIDNGAGGGNPNLLTGPASDCNWDVYSLTVSRKGPYQWSRFGSTISLAASSSLPFSGLCINTGSVAGGETTACQVAELLVYSNALLPEQVWAIQAYLSWKWGLESNLPRFHPYVSSMAFMQSPGPLQMSNAPYLWLDALYTRYQNLSGNNIVTLSNIGSIGFNFASNASFTTAQTNINSFGGLSTIRLTNGASLGATMIMTGAMTSNPRSIVVITRNTTQLANGGFLGFLTTSNISGGQNFLLSYNGTSYTCQLSSSGQQFTVTFTCVNSPLNNINFYVVVDAQNTSFNNATENGNVRTLTSNIVNGYSAGNINYYLGMPSYNNAQDMGEYIQFQYDVSPAERQMLEGYIAWKWTQVGSLPTLHPFKQYPPLTPVFSPVAINGLNTTTGGRGPLQCVLWMDAAQDSTANGASVTSVVDRSGSGYSIVPVAGNTITKTDPGLNGRPVFNFGANRMTVTNFIWRTKFTCFFVTQTNLGNWLYSQMFSSTYFNYIYAGNQALALIDVNASVNDSVNASAVSVTGTGWNIFVFGYNNGATGTPYRVNGTTRTTTNINIVKGDITTNTNLFLNGNQNGQFDTTQVAEILHYNDNLTFGQVLKIEGYLAWKWGLVSNLPVTHPYRIAPP